MSKFPHLLVIFVYSSFYLRCNKIIASWAYFRHWGGGGMGTFLEIHFLKKNSLLATPKQTLLSIILLKTFFKLQHGLNYWIRSASLKFNSAKMRLFFRIFAAFIHFYPQKVWFTSQNAKCEAIIPTLHRALNYVWQLHPTQV